LIALTVIGGKSVPCCEKTSVWRPEIGPKHFDKFKLGPGSKSGTPEIPGPTYNSAFRFKIKKS